MRAGRITRLLEGDRVIFSLNLRHPNTRSNSMIGLPYCCLVGDRLQGVPGWKNRGEEGQNALNNGILPIDECSHDMLHTPLVFSWLDSVPESRDDGWLPE